MGELESSEVRLVSGVPLANIGSHLFSLWLLLSVRHPFSTTTYSTLTVRVGFPQHIHPASRGNLPLHCNPCAGEIGISFTLNNYYKIWNLETMAQGLISVPISSSHFLLGTMSDMELNVKKGIAGFYFILTQLKYMHHKNWIPHRQDEVGPFFFSGY